MVVLNKIYTKTGDDGTTALGTAVGTADFLSCANDHGAVHVTLLHLATRNGFLNRDDDDIADTRNLAAGAAENLDALHTARTGVIGNLEV